MDCTQAEVEPALAPKIYNRETKQEIYGGAAVDTDTAVKRGIVGYVTSLADAKKAVDRVGQRPMVVPAAAAVANAPWPSPAMMPRRCSRQTGRAAS